MTDRSLTTNLILPLIVPRHLCSLLSSKYGFVNGYLHDINKPYLDNHIIILFKSISNIFDFDKRHNALRMISNFYTWYRYTLNGEYYDVYVYTRQTGDIDTTQYIKDILNCDLHYVPYEIKLNILSYMANTIYSKAHEILFTTDEILITKQMLSLEILPEADKPPGGILELIDDLVIENS